MHGAEDAYKANIPHKIPFFYPFRPSNKYNVIGWDIV
jgi:hypothetical protein